MSENSINQTARITGDETNPMTERYPKLKSFSIRQPYLKIYITTRWILDANKECYSCVCGEKVTSVIMAEQHLDALDQKELGKNHRQSLWKWHRKAKV